MLLYALMYLSWAVTGMPCTLPPPPARTSLANFTKLLYEIRKNCVGLFYFPTFIFSQNFVQLFKVEITFSINFAFEITAIVVPLRLKPFLSSYYDVTAGIEKYRLRLFTLQWLSADVTLHGRQHEEQALRRHR